MTSGASTLDCAHDQRRDEVRRSGEWNGIDFVEVDEAQITLVVFFLDRVPEGIGRDNLLLTGGRGPKDAVTITEIDVQPAEDHYFDDRLLVHLDKPGDYSTYTLALAGLERIDPRYASATFSFKAGCPSELDCAPACDCEPESWPTPAIDYLSKDYASFRQLILDRLALTCPAWTERHVPDIGIALVELLAYVGDYLSYHQDAVATEAYLATARRRPSVRRHARLVDYRLGEGCNARALVAVEVERNLRLAAADLRFVTALAGPATTNKAALISAALEPFGPDAYEVFEPLGEQDVRLWVGNNRLRFHTWGGRECCLRKGATSATLRGELALRWQEPDEAEDDEQDEQAFAAPATAAEGTDEQPEWPRRPRKVRLREGDLLIFQEMVGPVTGNAADADPRHRQAVRLTSVEQSRDELLDEPVIEIAWAEADALRFDLCLSAIGGAPECRFLEDVSVAFGNVVPVDHGRRVGPEDLGEVPTIRSEQSCECEGQPTAPELIPGRYRPSLERTPLTFAAPATPGAPAADLLAPDPREAIPAISLLSSSGESWQPRPDLLDSASSDRAFVVEMEEDRTARLLFGDGALARRPAAGERFTATYRLGSGPAGNVGAGAIAHLVHTASDLSNDVLSVTNPMAASGGTVPEPMAEAKLNAPHAWRFGPQALMRAITPEDYAAIAGRNPMLQRAAARFAWSGSWYEAEVALDPRAAFAHRGQALVGEAATALEPFRRIGHELDPQLAIPVPLDLAIEVCIKPDYQRGHVRQALLDAFGNRALPGGRMGLFHPDRLSFGQPVYLSQLIAAAHAVPGVAHATVTRLERQFEGPAGEIEAGHLALGPFEVAQLENDPNHPDRGRLAITVTGGR